MIFLHREGSLRPFVRKFARLHLFADILEAQDNKGSEVGGSAVGVRPELESELAKDLRAYSAALEEGRLLEVSFKSVVDYLHLLRWGRLLGGFQGDS